jgi:hypothetical protein
MSLKEITGPLSAAVKANPAPTERMFGNLPGKKRSRKKTAGGDPIGKSVNRQLRLRGKKKGLEMMFDPKTFDLIDQAKGRGVKMYAEPDHAGEWDDDPDDYIR